MHRLTDKLDYVNAELGHKEAAIVDLKQRLHEMSVRADQSRHT